MLTFLCMNNFRDVQMFTSPLRFRDNWVHAIHQVNFYVFMYFTPLHLFWHYNGFILFCEIRLIIILMLHRNIDGVSLVFYAILALNIIRFVHIKSANEFTFTSPERVSFINTFAIKMPFKCTPMGFCPSIKLDRLWVVTNPHKGFRSFRGFLKIFTSSCTHEKGWQYVDIVCFCDNHNLKRHLSVFNLM